MLASALKMHRMPLALIILLFGVSGSAVAQGAREEKDQFRFAQRLYDEGDYAIAAQEFSEFISHFPTSDRLPEAIQRLGEAYLRGGLYRKAIGACQGFIDKYPGHFNVATVMRRKAQALASLEEYTKAGAAFQEVHDAFIGGEYASQDLLDAGYNFRLGKDYDASASAFRALLSRYPSSHLVHEATYNLGLVLLEAGRPEEALAQFWSLVDYTGPTERKPDALLQIGRIALSHEYDQEADRAFAKLRKEFPKSPAAETSYLVMARWLSERGEWDQAARTYEMAREALPRSDRREQAVLGLAEAYRKLGKSKEALGLYTQFLSVYPSSALIPHARLGLGRSYADLGDHQRALPAFKLLLEGVQDTTVVLEAYSEMGDIWREQGATQKALHAYESCLAYANDPATAASARLRIAALYETDLKWYDRAAET
ncbi:MAG: tetratricopeptide repeat protein, partial [Candidatus Latescibacteria bacterium]|nr:tetratricopeptide repeat protein [Candidatus Latescibacterota bacterium]